MIFTKAAHQSAKFQTFDCSGEISPNWYFDRLLLLKVYKISANKVQRSYVLWYWRVMKTLKKSRMLIQALKSLQNLNFDCSLSCKVYNVWPKKVQRSNLSWHWRVIWRKAALWFGKWHEEFGKFSLEQLKVSKLVLSWTLLSKVENTWAKNLQRSYV